MASTSMMLSSSSLPPPSTQLQVRAVASTARIGGDTVLHPTTHGMCLVDAQDEMYCSERPGQVTVRSALPTTKFIVKATVNVSLSRHDAVVRCLHYPSATIRPPQEGPSSSTTPRGQAEPEATANEWIWCAASTRELFAVHAITKKLTLVADVAAASEFGPIISLADIVTRRPNSTGGTSSMALIVGMSREGVLSLWDPTKRVLLRTVKLTESDDISRTMPLSSIRCVTPWDVAGILFLGGSRGALHAVDLRRMLHIAVHRVAFEDALRNSPHELSLADEHHLLCSAMEEQARRADCCTIWLGTSGGSIYRVRCQLTSGAHQEGCIRVVTTDIVPRVHDGFCHKILCTSGRHVVSCGADGRIAILHADTLVVLQRVVLDPGLMVSEIMSLGERVRGTVTVLFALTDRSFRCLGLRIGGSVVAGTPARATSPPTSHRAPSSRHVVLDKEDDQGIASPSRRRMRSPARTGTVLPVSGGRGVAFHSPSASPIRSAHHLIHHCLNLLKDLAYIERQEAPSRLAIEDEERIAYSELRTMAEYCGGGRLFALSGALVRLQVEALAVRHNSLSELYFASREESALMNRHWVALCASDAKCVAKKRLETDEAVRRLAIEEAQAESFELHRRFAWEAAETAHQLAAQSTHTAVCEELLDELRERTCRFDEHERKAIALDSALADIQQLRASLISVSEAFDDQREELIALRGENAQLKDSLASVTASANCERWSVFGAQLDSARHRVAEEAAWAMLDVVLKSRRVECREYKRVVGDLHDERHQESARRQQCIALEHLSVQLQRDLHEAELSQSDHRGAVHRAEEENDRLREQIDDLKARLKLSSEQLHYAELENVRTQAKLDQHKSRCEELNRLAEDTFQTVLVQQSKLRSQQSTMDSIKAVVGDFVTLTEREFDASLTDNRLKDARSVLRMVLDELAASRRTESQALADLEEEMTASWGNWENHSAAAGTATSRRTSLPANATGSHPNTDTHVSQAFRLVCKALELIGPEWGEQVLLLERRSAVTITKRLVACLGESEAQ